MTARYSKPHETKPVADLEIPRIKAQAKEIVANAIRRGWIKPATTAPLTDAQIDSMRKVR